MPTSYDVTRAAIAGGFEDDLDLGIEVAHRLVEVLDRLIGEGTSDLMRIHFETLTDIAELWEGDPTGDVLWVGQMITAVNAMLGDMQDQVHEARESTPFAGAGEANR